VAGSGLARVLTGGGGHILALFIGCITTPCYRLYHCGAAEREIRVPPIDYCLACNNTSTNAQAHVPCGGG